MPKTNSKSANIVNTVWWDKAGTVNSKKFTDEHFAPNLGKLIVLAQKEIEKVICLAACQKAKTVGKFNRMTISVKVTPEVEFGIVTKKPEAKKNEG